MKCPNCNKKPVGLFPGFRLKRVGFRKAFKGYFKCKHCGTLLRHVVESGIAQYRNTYWYAQVGFLFLILLSAWLSFYLTNNYSEVGLYPVYGFLVFSVVIIGFIDSYLKPRYWIIEEANYKHGRVSGKDITRKGWGVFIVYTITAIVLAVGLPELLQRMHFSGWTVLSGIILYCGMVIAGGVYIIDRFSTSRAEES